MPLTVEDGKRLLNFELHSRDIKKNRLAWVQLRIETLTEVDVAAALERFAHMLLDPQGRLAMAAAIVADIKGRQQ